MSATLILGMFVGLLPCADCSAIRTQLTLDPEYYELRETYLGTERSLRYRGRWKANGDIIALEGEARRSFRAVGDSELRLLDGEQREVDSKAPHSLYWAVVLTPRDKGSIVELKRGRSLVVRLPSERLPGYAWQRVPAQSGILTPLGDVAYEESTETWMFAVSGAGQEELGFEYRQPSQPKEASAARLGFLIRAR
ncbi:MAG TPA: copper resistance protein NlpE N-terminal domain-containing protein [Burkholderiales bacterium]|jgi:predicted secreted protein|nr:copper resistance protein NlpE N-terminal domain-containing protein [Burkholderiales bacterium]